MKLILTSDVLGLGAPGDVVDVKTPAGILRYSIVRISKPKGLAE